MANLQKHINRVNALHKKLQPNPTIIDCSGAKDELLAVLERYRNDESPELSEEDRLLESQLDAMLDESVKHIQETYNIKLVSYA